MSGQVQEVTDTSFEKEVIQSSIPVIVDFWAAWCGPCKAFEPIFKEAASQYEGKVKFLKLDVDHNPETPPKFGIRGIPTLILFNQGQVKTTHVGSLNKAGLLKLIDDEMTS